MQRLLMLNFPELHGRVQLCSGYARPGTPLGFLDSRRCRFCLLRRPWSSGPEQRPGIGMRALRFIGRRFILISTVCATVGAGVYVAQVRSNLERHA